MGAQRAVHVVVGSALAALLLTGCVAPTPSPSPAPSPSPSITSPTATPSPTPSTTPSAPVETTSPVPVFSVDDPGTWLIDFSGIGPVQIGTPIPDIESALPQPPNVCRPGVDGFFDDTIVAVGFDAAAPLSMALAQLNGQLAEGEGPGHPRTAAGIGPGSTVEQMFAAYPDAEPYTGYGDQTVYRITDGTTWIHFQPYGGDVIREVTVQQNDVFPKEYCG